MPPKPHQRGRGRFWLMQRHSSQVFVSKPTSPLHLLPPVELPHTHASSPFLSTLPSPLQIHFPHHLFYTPSPFCSISTFFPNDSLLQFFLATLSPNWCLSLIHPHSIPCSSLTSLKFHSLHSWTSGRSPGLSTWIHFLSSFSHRWQLHRLTEGKRYM